MFSISKGVILTEETVTVPLETLNESPNSNNVYTFLGSDNGIVYRYIQVINDKTNRAEVIRMQENKTDIFYDLKIGENPYAKIDLKVKDVNLTDNKFVILIYEMVFGTSNSYTDLDEIFKEELGEKEINRIKSIEIHVNANE
jgi:hypothetical protein